MSIRSGTGGAKLSLPWTRRSGYSVSLWAKFEGTFTGGEGNLFSTDDASVTWSQFVYNATAGKMTWFTDIGGPGSAPVDITAPTTTSPATSRWFWVGMRFVAAAGTTGDLEIIIWDPAARKFTTANVNNNGGAVTKMWLCSDGYNEAGDWSVRHLKLWDPVLSRKELIQELRQGEPLRRAGLHSYLPFRNAQATGSTAFNLDKSGHGNDWTITGAFTTRNVAGQLNDPPVPDRIEALFTKRAYALVRSAGGGTNTPKTITATQTQTASRTRAISMTRTATQTQTVIRLRAVARALSASGTQTPIQTHTGGGTNTPKTLTVTQTQTPSLARSVGIARAANETQTTGTSPAIAGALSLSANQTQTPTRVRALSPVAKTATNAQTPSAAKGIATVKTANETQTASLVKGAGFFKTLTATQTQTASRARALGIVRAVTSTATGSVARALSRLRSATNSQVTALGRALGLSRSTTSNATPTQAHSGGGSQSLTLTATQTQTPSLSRVLNLFRSSSQAQAPAVQRAIVVGAKTATQTQTLSLVKGSGFFKTLTATITQAVSRAISVGRPRTATQTQTLAVGRALASSKSVTNAQTPVVTRALATQKTKTQTQTPSLTKGNGFLKTLTATITQAATRALGAGLSRSATQTQTPTVQRALARALAVTNAQAPAAAKALSLTKSANQTQAPSLLKGQGYFKTLTATVTQSPTVRRAAGIVRLFVAIQVATRLRSLARALSGVSTQLPSQTGDGIGTDTPMALTAQQTQSPSLTYRVTPRVIGGRATYREESHRARLYIVAMSTGLQGTQRRILVDFTDFKNRAADPTSATVTVGTLGTFPLARLTRGTWFYDPPSNTAPGRYPVTVVSIGSVVAAAHGVFEILPL